jgi:hypothetical protein
METRITDEEFLELCTLKEAINNHPASVHYLKMERFTELFVKSLAGRGENCTFSEPTNF